MFCRVAIFPNPLSSRIRWASLSLPPSVAVLSSVANPFPLSLIFLIPPGFDKAHDKDSRTTIILPSLSVPRNRFSRVCCSGRSPAAPCSTRLILWSLTPLGEQRPILFFTSFISELKRVKLRILKVEPQLNMATRQCTQV